MKAILPIRRYRTIRGDAVVDMQFRERKYPHGIADTHPWLITLCDAAGKRYQHWYTRDGYWAAAGKSELDLAELTT